jgi:hypothetical protein
MAKMNQLGMRIVAMLALLLTSIAAVAVDEPAVEPYDSWYVLKLGGQRAGHMRASLRVEDETIVTQTEMVMAIKRGEAEVRIEQRSRFVETLDHEPVSSESGMKLALMETEQRIDFGEDKWTITSSNAGQTSTTTTEPIDTDWLTPGGLYAYTAERIAAGDDALTATTLDPSMGVTPVTITMKRGEAEDVEVFGRVIPATRWLTTMTNAPGVEVELWADAAGQPVKQMIPLLPGMEIEMLLADKDLALAEFDAPEMLASSLIKPSKPIDRPRQLKRGVFDLVSKGLKQKLGDTVPNAGWQTTEWIDDDTLRVTIGSKAKPRGFDAAKHTGRLPQDFADYLASTAVLNHKDPVVAKLADEAFRTAPPGARVVRIGDQIATARHVTQVVRDTIDAKDLSVGFATASEVARTKKGDCTEHACLLAAVLRGGQMPARTVTGLVYADQFAGERDIFGFHMWTQVWVADERNGGFWVDLDAALPGDIGGFDATHIALSTSAMKDGETFNDMVALLPLMQGLKIEVIETEWAD